MVPANGRWDLIRRLKVNEAKYIKKTARSGDRIGRRLYFSLKAGTNPVLETKCFIYCLVFITFINFKIPDDRQIHVANDLKYARIACTSNRRGFFF